MGFDPLHWLRARIGEGQVLGRTGNSVGGVDVSSLTPGGHFVPATTNTYDLGLTGTRWRTLYLGTALAVNVADATADGVSRPVTVTHTTTGTPAAGIGAGILLQVPSTAGTLRSAGAVDALHTFAVDGAELSALVLRAGMGGTLFEAARFAAALASVNGLQVTASATGQPVVVAARGDDANVSLNLKPKGAGAVSLVDSADVARLTVNSTGIGLHGATPVAQGAAIADATNGTDVITQLNLLLAHLRLRGDIAT